jgi:hypothetical protein
MAVHARRPGREKPEAPVTATSRPRDDRPVAIADHARVRKSEQQVRGEEADPFSVIEKQEGQREITPAGGRARGGAMAAGGGCTKSAPAWLG